MDASACFDRCVVPVVTVSDLEQVSPLAEVLISAGCRFIEVTLRSDVALEAVRRIRSQHPQLTAGVGSIRQVTQIEQALDAGAEFLVSPGCTWQLLEGIPDGVPFIPGAASASEMLRLLEQGYRLQKFFPAEALGGLAMLKALSAPMPEIRFFPTGGINTGLAEAYFSFEKVQCIGGSWFLPKEVIEQGNWSELTELTQNAMELCRI